MSVYICGKFSVILFIVLCDVGGSSVRCYNGDVGLIEEVSFWSCAMKCD